MSLRIYIVVLVSFLLLSFPELCAQSSAPTATAATNITASSFTANWTSVSGAFVYFLDVSTSPSFSSFISGFNNYAQTGSGKTVTGLTSGTTYYYRVRVQTSAGLSGSSNTMSATPNAPLPVPATLVASEWTT